MKIKRLTITGADNSIRPEELIPLSDEFPFIEWAILFSQSKQGTSRYPSLDWVEELGKLSVNQYNLHLAGHLCGQWVRDLSEGKYDFPNHFSGFVYRLWRIQLNMTDSMFKTLDLEKVVKAVNNHPSQIILQTKTQFERRDEILEVNKETANAELQMLYDTSGGLGRLPKSWCTPPDGIYCGLAGGLGPDNLEEQLEKMQDVVGDHEIWIDFETKARFELDDTFSIDKCRRAAELVASWKEKNE